MDLEKHGPLNLGDLPAVDAVDEVLLAKTSAWVAPSVAEREQYIQELNKMDWPGDNNVKDLTKENPKYVQALKDGKMRLDNLVLTMWEGDSAVHALGADKYGERNWRADPIKSSTYEAAILRHFLAYFSDGQSIDPESGWDHLYHIRACCAVMLDAEKHGTLIDDRGRQHSGGNTS